MKRKREELSEFQDVGLPKSKRSKTADQRTKSHVTHPVLSRYYSSLTTLREFLLARLPESNSRRRRQLLRLCRQDRRVGPLTASQAQHDALVQLLDTTLVGSGYKGKSQATHDDYTAALADFSQAQSLSLGTAGTLKSTVGTFDNSYTEVLDFALWLLFHKKYASASRPPHMLCQGLQRATQMSRGVFSTIPGLRLVQHNEHLEFLRGPLWKDAFRTLGKGGDAVVLDMILHCGVFVSVPGSRGSFYQLSGELLSEMSVLEEQQHPPSAGPKVRDIKSNERLDRPLHPASIRLVRHRMLYARPALNARHAVSLGMRHIHVLCRYPNAEDKRHTSHILKYIFPRQFGLHNVFTSRVDARETSQTFKDYSLREKEIAWMQKCNNFGRRGSSEPREIDPIPKRLRGRAMELVQRMQRLHRRCSYALLLAHYCPGPSCFADSSSSIPHFEQLVTPFSQVSAFCRAAALRVVPRGFLGEDEIAKANWAVTMQNIDAFVRARRFETFSLESLLNNLKISKIGWMHPVKAQRRARLGLSDLKKRQELLAEFIYWLFDSFIIPLVRFNFHVTESGVHKNRLFYFRHDVWQRLTEPHVSSLKLSLYEDVGSASAVQAMGQTTSRACQFRLLPKDKGMRTIVNLRRRPQVLVNGKVSLGRSINTTLKPAFTVLNFERERRPGKFGGSLFSVGGMYEKIRDFRQSLERQDLLGKQLYFVKVDVKSCFDNLSQDKVVGLVRRLLASSQYDISRHCEVAMPLGHTAKRDRLSKPARNFVAQANAPGRGKALSTVLAESPIECKRHAIYVDNVVTQRVKRQDVFDLVEQHVRHNLVKVGKRFYRQKQGIAQGSVLSSLLCNLLFADFESRQLQREPLGHSMMLRLIDDFLFVTTDKAQAERFLDTMHLGNADYGITVKTEKSLVNFATCRDTVRVPSLAEETTRFPFCGLMIDTHTLDISKDEARFCNPVDSLSIEYSKRPGQVMQDKMANTLKMHMLTMLLDSSHNASRTVYENVWRVLSEAAARSFSYIQSVASLRRCRAAILIALVERLDAVAQGVVRSESHRRRNAAYRCGLSRLAVRWMTSSAFLQQWAVSSKSSNGQHGLFLAWLTDRVGSSWPASRWESNLLKSVTMLNPMAKNQGNRQVIAIAHGRLRSIEKR